MAEQYEVENTEQESPSVEDNQLPTDATPTAEGARSVEEPINEKESSQDRNWREVRDRLQALEAENKRLREMSEPNSLNSYAPNESISAGISPEETAFLSRDEIKAELKFPELETKNLFSKAVAGEYRMELDKYVRLKNLGQNPKLPSAYEIAKRMKAEWDQQVGSVSKKAETEGAKKAQKAIETKESTVEVEGRNESVRRGPDLSSLQKRSREGHVDAIAERLSRL